MTTIQSTTSQTKSVNIYQNHNSNFRAMYVQTYKGEQQVLQGICNHEQRQKVGNKNT